MSVHMKVLLDNLYKTITEIMRLILTSYCSNQMSQLEKKWTHNILLFHKLLSHQLSHTIITTSLHKTNAMPRITYKNCTAPHFLISNWNRNKDTNHYHPLCEQHDETLIQQADY